MFKDFHQRNIAHEKRRKYQSLPGYENDRHRFFSRCAFDGDPSSGFELPGFGPPSRQGDMARSIQALGAPKSRGSDRWGRFWKNRRILRMSSAGSTCITSKTVFGIGFATKGEQMRVYNNFQETERVSMREPDQMVCVSLPNLRVESGSGPLCPLPWPRS